MLDPVHGPDCVEPPLPPSLGQVLPHPGSLELLQGVKVGPSQPLVLKALRSGQPGMKKTNRQASLIPRIMPNL